MLESFQVHVPKGYIYFAMFFSMSVEALNLMRSKKTARRNNPRKPPSAASIASLTSHFTFSYQIKTYLRRPSPRVC